MQSKQLNLIDAYFQNSNFFRHMPIFDVIHYNGHPDGKAQLFTAVREEQECTIVAITMIRQEEDFLWDSAEDLLESCVWQASQAMHGVYTFDLLTFDFHKEAKSFDYKEMSQVIANESRRLIPGGERLIKYSSAYGILKKLLDESWAKVTFKTSVEVYKDKPKLLYLLVKRLFKLYEFPRNPLIVLINDVSSHPVYDPGNQEQNDLISKIIDEKSKDMMEFPPEVYMQNKHGVWELLSKARIR